MRVGGARCLRAVTGAEGELAHELALDLAAESRHLPPAVKGEPSGSGSASASASELPAPMDDDEVVETGAPPAALLADGAEASDADEEELSPGIWLRGF